MCQAGTYQENVHLNELVEANLTMGLFTEVWVGFKEQTRGWWGTQRLEQPGVIPTILTFRCDMKDQSVLPRQERAGTRREPHSWSRAATYHQNLGKTGNRGNKHQTFLSFHLSLFSVLHNPKPTGQGSLSWIIPRVWSPGHKAGQRRVENESGDGGQYGE